MDGIVFDGYFQSEDDSAKDKSAEIHKKCKSGLFYGLSYIGQRKNNEDTILVPFFEGVSNNSVFSRCYTTNLPGGFYLFAVADGMGGASSGEVASELAVKVVREEITEKLSEERDFNGCQLKNILKESLQKVQREIRAAIEKNSSLAGMGTTMVVLLVAKNKFIWANIGDSRLYMVKSGEIELLTKDHTYLQQYLEGRGKPPDEEWVKRYSSYLIRALDGTDHEPDIYPLQDEWEDFPDNSCLLLCSDGLVPAKDKLQVFPYSDILKSFDSPGKVCQQLVSTAYFDGSTDNISVILIEGPDYHHELKNINELPFPPVKRQKQKDNFSNSIAGSDVKAKNKFRGGFFVVLVGLVFCLFVSCCILILPGDPNQTACTEL